VSLSYLATHLATTILTAQIEAFILVKIGRAGVIEFPVSDLENLAHFFSVPITSFFPEIQPSSHIDALVRAAHSLDQDDLEEVTLYALFRRARQPKLRK